MNESLYQLTVALAQLRAALLLLDLLPMEDSDTNHLLTIALPQLQALEEIYADAITLEIHHEQ